MNNLSYACIGWGSLVPRPGDLPFDGTWREDGPILPVEFARESGGKLAEPGTRFTLVICPGVPTIRTYWTLLTVSNLQEAKFAIGRREFKDATQPWITKNIGACDLVEGISSGRESETVWTWAQGRGFAGVVWTSLPPGFKGSREIVPSCDEVIAWLKALPDSQQPDAREYICEAPLQTQTAYRHPILHAMGWA